MEIFLHEEKENIAQGYTFFMQYGFISFVSGRSADAMQGVRLPISDALVYGRHTGHGVLQHQGNRLHIVTLLSKGRAACPEKM